MCLDLDVVPPLAGFRLYAILGVFHHVLLFSLYLLYAFLKLLTVFDLFYHSWDNVPVPSVYHPVREEKISSCFQPRCLRLQV
jgi:hypothetical protein